MGVSDDDQEAKSSGSISPSGSSRLPEMAGVLSKWTNYIYGWQVGDRHCPFLKKVSCKASNKKNIFRLHPLFPSHTLLQSRSGEYSGTVGSWHRSRARRVTPPSADSPFPCLLVDISKVAVSRPLVSLSLCSLSTCFFVSLVPLATSGSFVSSVSLSLDFVCLTDYKYHHCLCFFSLPSHYYFHSHHCFLSYGLFFFGRIVGSSCVTDHCNTFVLKRTKTRAAVVLST